jgi:hypothetical protein
MTQTLNISKELFSNNNFITNLIEMFYHIISVNEIM